MLIIPIMNSVKNKTFHEPLLTHLGRGGSSLIRLIRLKSILGAAEKKENENMEIWKWKIRLIVVKLRKFGFSRF